MKFFYQKARPESQSTPKVIIRAHWQRESIGTGKPGAWGSSTDQIGAGKPGATSAAVALRVDTRTQGVRQKGADQQDDLQKLIATLVRTLLSDPDKDKLIREMQESRYNEYTPLSE